LDETYDSQTDIPVAFPFALILYDLIFYSCFQSFFVIFRALKTLTDAPFAVKHTTIRRYLTE
jgi:hypothetical protein